MMQTHHTTAPARFWQHKPLKLQYEEYADRKKETTNTKTESQEICNNNTRHVVVLPTPLSSPGDCDVKSYIRDNAKFYDGDSSFLVGPTPRTRRALEKFKKLLSDEREAGGVLSVDCETPSTITSHAPGYLLSKDEDVIVGMQADEPLRRTCKPHGGYGVVKNALEAYGYEPGEKIKAFKDDVVTHNDMTFSMYTSQVSQKYDRSVWLIEVSSYFGCYLFTIHLSSTLQIV